MTPATEHRNINPDSFAGRYGERMELYRQRWEDELHEHVPDKVPHFDEVERCINRHLRRAGLL